MAKTNIQAFSGEVEVASNLQVGTANLFVDITTGKVGIGKTNPTQLLDIVGNVAANVNTLFVDTVTSRVGIGTSNPSTNFDVNGNVNIGSTLTVSGFRITAAAAAEDDLQAITNAGADTTNQIHITNATRAISSSTGALRVGDSGAPGGIGVVGNVYVGDTVTTQDLSVNNVISDFAVNTNDLFVDISESKVGILTTQPHAELHVVGNVYASSNLTVDTDTFHVDAENDRVGVNTKNPEASLHLVGNAFVSSNLTVDTDTFHVDAENDRVGVNTKNPEASLHLVGNAFVSSNLEVGTANLFVDTVNSRVGIGTTSPFSKLTIMSDDNDAATSLNPSAQLVLATTGADLDDDGDVGSSLVFTQRWYESLYPDEYMTTGSIHGYKNAGQGNYGGGLIFKTQPASAGTPSEKMRIDAAGYVGIGTTNPNTKLHVEHYGSEIGDFEGIRIANHATNLHASSRPAYEFVVSDINANTGIGNGKFAIGYRSTTSASRLNRLVIDSSGNVGIGKTNPGSTLDVNGTMLASRNASPANYSFFDTLGSTDGTWRTAFSVGSTAIGFFSVQSYSAGVSQSVAIWYYEYKAGGTSGGVGRILGSASPSFRLNGQTVEHNGNGGNHNTQVRVLPFII